MHYSEYVILKILPPVIKGLQIFILYSELQPGLDWQAVTGVKGSGVGAGVSMVGPETHPEASRHQEPGELEVRFPVVQ